MAQMTAATGAMDFGAGHEQRAIRLSFDGIGQRLVKARPSCAAFKFRFRREHRQIATGAAKRALALFAIERARAGALGAVLAQDIVSVRRQPLSPFFIGQLFKTSSLIIFPLFQLQSHI